MMGHELLIIFECRGFNAQPLARLIRSLGVYSEVYSCLTPIDILRGKQPKGVIIAGKRSSDSVSGNGSDGVNCADGSGDGGFESVDGSDTDRIARVAESVMTLGVPVFGIGCEIKNLFATSGGRLSFYSENVPCKEAVSDFLFKVCGFSGDWKIARFIDKTIRDLKERIGDKKTLLALSGGVDSTVCAALLSRAIGNQLTCVFVDHGLHRKDEPEAIEALCKNLLDINFIKIDAAKRFLSRLSGVIDPELKRKIIGEEFIRVFEEAAGSLNDMGFLAQGTIYPDVIESGTENAALVKSHHNVGGLPKDMGFCGIVEPLRALFKEEVRLAGLELGIPEDVVWRQPCPGPALAVRVLGEVTEDKLSILRDADAIYREEIAAAGLAQDISQYFAVLTNIQSVGVRGGARSYEYMVALRAVRTIDFMTAEYVRVPYDVLERSSSRITSEVPRVNRVVYDITSKPPSTIEWE